MSVEEGLYQWWLEGKYFEATGDEKKQHGPFLEAIVHRILAYASYELKYLEELYPKHDLSEEGISRYDLGREKFLEKAWEWKEEYASHIRQQWGKVGFLCCDTSMVHSWKP
jgi:valyl-tRNA synthetase